MTPLCCKQLEPDRVLTKGTTPFNMNESAICLKFETVEIRVSQLVYEILKCMLRLLIFISNISPQIKHRLSNRIFVKCTLLSPRQPQLSSHLRSRISVFSFLETFLFYSQWHSTIKVKNSTHHGTFDKHKATYIFLVAL